MYELQGRLTSQRAERLVDELDPRGVVVIDAEHFCMTMRGVQNPESKPSSCSELPDDPASARATRRSD
jgi:GTP cyclohydrolase I